MNNFELFSFGGALTQWFSSGKVSNNYRNPGLPVSPVINFPY